ncbi:hypothetical protein ACFSC6_04600 [Rufibacter sediminis]|uniref:ABC transporter permease n=1 Tax=Rufibacter sediminis TaxID=2762756 RepID=A0ABR6VS30_9BACT|nr:hypothetical protein [Rufibacter sediminis]MBC3539998.1 hypothetical protein [Rufibacter sediminis]
MNPLRIFYLLYCGTCVIAGLALIVDFYLPKKQERISVTETWMESSKSSLRSPSSHSYNYFLTLEDQVISVNRLVFSETNIGDTLNVLKTTILNRIYGFKSKDGTAQIVFSRLYSLFPLIPILLIIPGFSFFVKRETALSEFLMPFNLIVPVFIWLII